MKGLDDVEMVLVTMTLACELKNEHDDRERQYWQPILFVNARCGFTEHP